MLDQHPSAGEQPDGGFESGKRESAGRTKAMAKDEVRDLKVQGREVADQVKQAAEGAIERRSTKVADSLDSVGHAMRLAAEDLDGEGQEWLGDYTRRAAGQVERVGRYLHDEDAPAMLADLEDMARKNPGTFLGTSFAAGVAAGRFLRSSRPEQGFDRKEQHRQAYSGDEHGTPAVDGLDQSNRGPGNGGAQHQPGMPGPAAGTSWHDHPTSPGHERRR